MPATFPTGLTNGGFWNDGIEVTGEIIGDREQLFGIIGWTGWIGDALNWGGGL